MEAPARALLAEGASRVVAWKKTPTSSSSATVLFSSFSPPPTDNELSSLERLFEDREAAIRSGMVLEGKRFEVRGEGRGKRTKTENRKKKNSGEERELVLPIFFKAQPETKRPQKTGPPPPPPSGIRPRDGHGSRAGGRGRRVPLRGSRERRRRSSESGGGRGGRGGGRGGAEGGGDDEGLRRDLLQAPPRFGEDGAAAAGVLPRGLRGRRERGGGWRRRRRRRLKRGREGGRAVFSLSLSFFFTPPAQRIKKESKLK